MAHSSDGATPACYRWHWLNAGVGRPDRGDQGGRRDRLPTYNQALAWSLTHHYNDSYRHHGNINGKNVEWMEKVTDEHYNGK